MSLAKLVEVSVNMGFLEFISTSRYLSRYNLNVPTHSACGDGIFQVGRSMPLFLGGIYPAREYAFIDTLSIRNCGKKVDNGQ